MKKLLLMSLVALVAITITSCLGGNPGKAVMDAIENGDYTEADSTPTQVTEINQVTAMQSFNEVSITGKFKVIYEQGTDYNVRVEATEQALKEMTIHVQDSALCICKSVDKPVSNLGDVKIYVSSPNLNRIFIDGSGVFAADNAINVVDSNLVVSAFGASKVQLTSVTCSNYASFDVMGSGSIEVKNLKAKEVLTLIGESPIDNPYTVGSINMANLECKLLRAYVIDSGNINCDNITADEVITDVSGTGMVNLKGTVKDITKNIKDKGKFNYTEATPTDKNE